MIDITMIGTSALVPLPERALTAALLCCGGHSILFDCGEGTQSAARKAEVSLMKTDLIALTHYHGDHIFGLPGLLQTMSSMGRTEPLYITGPGEPQRELEPIMQLTGYTSYAIHFISIPEEPMRLCTVIPGWPFEAQLSCFRTEHRVPSQGYCFTLDRAGKFNPAAAKALEIPIPLWGRLQKGESVEANGRTFHPEQVLGAPRKGLKFVFSGDTAPCSSLTASARDADLFICEATYGENEQADLALDHGHMNFAQAALTAADAGAKALWLTHFSQMITDPQEYLENATVIFPNTLCGMDGMKTTLQFE